MKYKGRSNNISGWSDWGPKANSWWQSSSDFWQDWSWCVQQLLPYNPIHLAGFECCLLMGIPMMDMDWCDFTSSDSYLQKKRLCDCPNFFNCPNWSACQSSHRLRSCSSWLVMRCMSALSSRQSWLSWRAWTLSWWCSTWSADWFYVVGWKKKLAGNYLEMVVKYIHHRWKKHFLWFLTSLNGLAIETCTVKNCLTLCMGENM